jgi:hypothetical protein
MLQSIFGIIETFLAVVGACNGCGPQLAIHLIAFAVNLPFSFFGCIVNAFTLAAVASDELYNYSEYKTIT